MYRAPTYWAYTWSYIYRALGRMIQSKAPCAAQGGDFDTIAEIKLCVQEEMRRLHNDLAVTKQQDRVPTYRALIYGALHI